jgi:glycosyltransferase involved in cell wall biosynthesis
MSKFSVIITTRNEHKLLRKCITSIFTSLSDKYEGEVIVVAPDKKSEEVAKEFECRYLKDPGKGKITALNLALKEVTGDYLIFTDGDCEIEGLDKLFNELDTKVYGLVTGKVEPKKNNIDTKWDFFHKFLLGGADYIRKRKRFIEASAYLMGVRKDLVTEFPYDVAEDSWLSVHVHQQGYSIGYVTDSIVKVSGPENYEDWMSQKTRTAIAHEKQKGPRIKTFKNEVMYGLLYTLTQLPKLRLIEWFWLPQLYALRLWSWIVVKHRVYVGEGYGDNWKPVKSTKR